MDVYASELRAYHAERELYERDEQEYERRKRHLDDEYDHERKACKAGDADACGRKKRIDQKRSDLWWEYKSVNGRLSEEPVAPKRPSLAEETETLVRHICDRECGCERSFEICFSGCGGTVRIERFCLENCD